MKESYDEGLANHIGPESCGYDGNVIFEALTGGNAGRVLSLEIGENSSERRRTPRIRKATPGTPQTRGVTGLGGVIDPLHAWKLFTRDAGGPGLCPPRDCAVDGTENP